MASDVIWRELIDLATTADAPLDRLDVGSGGVRRLLHRPRRRCHRRAAGDADRIDRRLHRQVRHQRHARQARRERRSDEQRQARRDLLARSAASRPRSGRRSKSRCRTSTTSSSSAPRRRATWRRRRWTRLRRAASGRESRRNSSASLTSSGGLYKAIDHRQAARPHPDRRGGRPRRLPAAAQFYEVIADQLTSPAARIRPPIRPMRCWSCSDRESAARSPPSWPRRGCSAAGKCWRTCRMCL